MSSLFTKIIQKEIPASILYEDELCIVFLDIFPIKPGHLLVVPKEEKAKVCDLSAEAAKHLLAIAQKIMRALEKSDLNPEGFSLFINDGLAAGQEVPHCHLHIVPRNSSDKLGPAFQGKGSAASRDQLEKLAKALTGLIN